MSRIETVVRNYYEELRRITGSDRSYSYNLYNLDSRDDKKTEKVLEFPSNDLFVKLVLDCNLSLEDRLNGKRTIFIDLITQDLYRLFPILEAIAIRDYKNEDGSIEPAKIYFKNPYLLEQELRAKGISLRLESQDGNKFYIGDLKDVRKLFDKIDLRNQEFGFQCVEVPDFLSIHVYDKEGNFYVLDTAPNSGIETTQDKILEYCKFLDEVIQRTAIN